jgi:F0F1-type ATP synthase alpha subunit
MQILSYADDIDIIRWSQAAVREVFLALKRETNKVVLKINEKKTKYMIAAGNKRTIRDVGQSVAFGDKTFEVIKEFVYLGSLVTPKNDVSLDIQIRIQTAEENPVEASFTSNKIHHLQDLDPPGPAVWQ